MRLGRSACSRYVHWLGSTAQRPRKRCPRRTASSSPRSGPSVLLCLPSRGRRGDELLRGQGHVRVDGDLARRWVSRRPPGDLDLPDLRSEGKLLLGGVPGYRGRGVEGTDRHKLVRHERVLPAADRANHTGPLVVFWDNRPARSGEEMGDYLAISDLGPHLVRAPIASTATPTRRSGPRCAGGHRRHRPRDRGDAGAAAPVLGRAANSGRRGQIPLPVHAASAPRRWPSRRPRSIPNPPDRTYRCLSLGSDQVATAVARGNRLTRRQVYSRAGARSC